MPACRWVLIGVKRDHLPIEHRSTAKFGSQGLGWLGLTAWCLDNVLRRTSFLEEHALINLGIMLLMFQRLRSDWDNCHSRLNKTTLKTHAAARLNNLRRTRFRPECPTASEGTWKGWVRCAERKVLGCDQGQLMRPAKRSHSRPQNIKMFQIARASTQRHLPWVFRRTSTPPSPLRPNASLA